MHHTHQGLALGRRARRLAVLIALAAALLSSAMVTGPVSNANAGDGEFCVGAWLAPYGSSGDRCWGNGNYLTHIQAYSAQHSICVGGAQNGWLVKPWSCASGPWTWTYMGFDGSRWLNPVVRNNAASNSQVRSSIVIWR